jgi:hypothetical protein
MSIVNYAPLSEFTFHVETWALFDVFSCADHAVSVQVGRKHSVTDERDARISLSEIHAQDDYAVFLFGRERQIESFEYLSSGIETARQTDSQGLAIETVSVHTYISFGSTIVYESISFDEPMITWTERHVPPFGSVNFLYVVRRSVLIAPRGRTVYDRRGYGSHWLLSIKYLSSTFSSFFMMSARSFI